MVFDVGDKVWFSINGSQELVPGIIIHAWTTDITRFVLLKQDEDISKKKLGDIKTITKDSNIFGEVYFVRDEYTISDTKEGPLFIQRNWAASIAALV